MIPIEITDRQVLGMEGDEQAGVAGAAGVASAVPAGKGKKNAGIYKNLRSRKTPPGGARKRGAGGSPPEARSRQYSKRARTHSSTSATNVDRDGSAGPGYEADPIDEDEHDEEEERGMSEDGSEPRLGLHPHVRYADEAAIATRLSQTLELDVLKEKVCAHSLPSSPSLPHPAVFLFLGAGGACFEMSSDLVFDYEL